LWYRAVVGAVNWNRVSQTSSDSSAADGDIPPGAAILATFFRRRRTDVGKSQHIRNFCFAPHCGMNDLL
jgi:hypothetical protein